MISAPAHRPSRRTHILTAALRVFGRSSEGGGIPTMGAVAREAEVTTAALYYHFSSRADLLVTLTTEIHPQVLGMFVKATADGRTNDWVTDLYAEVADWVDEAPEAARFYFLVAPATPDHELAVYCSRCRAEILEVLWSQVQRHRPDVTKARAWIYAHTLRELLGTAIELGLLGRDRPPRGFFALRTAAPRLAVDLLSDPPLPSP